MKQEWAQKWSAKLREMKDLQVRGLARACGDKRCALAVLCDLLGIADNVPHEQYFVIEDRSEKSEDVFRDVFTSAGIIPHKAPLISKIMRKNDILDGWTFEQIADFIDQNWQDI